jgi:ParB family chromosome partitioning protein
MAAKKASRARSGATPRPKKSARGKLAPGRVSRGLAAADVPIATDHPDVADLAALIVQAGGAPIGAYREPLGGRAILIASLPLAAVQPTPFQRDLSPTHVKRLAAKIDETGAFLDPLIVVRGEDGRLWTPNGRHRLAAAKVLGLKQITALISPNEALAYRILALNTEKAHNLKDRSLEVIRMARSLAKKQGNTKEADLTAEFEAAELITLGAVYEQNPRFAGGAYSPFLKKVDRFSDRPLATSLRERDAYAARLLEVDTQVKRIIADLTARGFKSPYLRNYVVARINPVRFHKAKKGDTKPPMPIAQALTRMAASAKKFDVKSVSNSEIAWVAVGAGAGVSE